MRYYVKVKPGHPTGVRRRSGLTFTQDESMVREVEMTDAIRTDAWLRVRVVGEPLTSGGTTPPAGEPPLSAEERERLTTFAANLHASAIAESDAASAAAATPGQGEAIGQTSEAEGEAVGGNDGDGRKGRKREQR